MVSSSPAVASASAVSPEQPWSNDMTTRSSGAPLAKAPVWFITGCSTGFGLDLAKLAIKHGYRTVVTARDPTALQGLASNDNVLVLTLDVTKPDQVVGAIAQAQARFGAIDVLVNNAGIGYFAAVEESEEPEVRKMFEVNVFGLSRMIQAVLPGMRARRQGVIVNFSSIGGLRAFPSVGFYNATKFAVEGLSEALWKEVEPLGIRVMVVEPSGFRTDWAGRSANESAVQIEDYLATAGAWRAQVRAVSGKQEGDPARAAQAVIAAVASGKPPHHLLLGNAAFDGAMAKLDELRKDFSAGEAVARGADFPRVETSIA
jgi:NAD(P)-dependent dehydrogenase (short-subunit alcohol dehydrogenase family)